MHNLSWIILSTSILLSPPHHLHQQTPRSRNWLAQEDGPGCSNSNPTCPPAEYCPHCLNNNIGVCGKFGSRNYETVNWLNKAGNPMPWVSQYGNTASPSGTFMTTSEYYETEYYEGGLITIDSFLSTHHAGHEEIRACVITDDPSSCTLPEHFPDENELIFVEDLVYDTNQREMFKDPTWPGRGYYSGGEAGGTKEFTHRYRLPDGIVGEKVLLQWKYITANSVSHHAVHMICSVSNLSSDLLLLIFICTFPLHSVSHRDMMTTFRILKVISHLTTRPIGNNL